MDWRLSHLDWEGWGGGKKLLHEIIPRFGLPRLLQSDNGTSFTSKVTQEVSKALVLTYYLHCAWRPVFRKSRKSQPILKISDKKDNPGDLHTCIAHKEQVGLSPYEMLYGRPFVYVNEFFLDPEAQTIQSYTMAIGQFQQDSTLVGCQPGPKRF